MRFTPEQATDAVAGKHRQLMVISDHRVFYSGQLGNPGQRNFGCATLYVSERNPLAVDRGEGWTSGLLAWVPPYTPHRIRSRDRQLAVIMVEPEYADIHALGAWLRGRTAQQLDSLRSGILAGVGRLRQQPGDMRMTDEAFDRLLFGRPLPSRTLDERVVRVLQQLCHHGDEGLTAASLAEAEGLSQSRFLHLFKEQTGICLRKYRAWRRARRLLYHVRSGATLTDIALETGYPDATHFSHSIRRIYGLPPREIVSGSRQLRLRVQLSTATDSVKAPAITPRRSAEGALAMV